MGLAKKIFLIITLILTLIVTIQFILSRAILLDGFKRLEYRDANKDVGRVVDAIEEQMLNLENKIIDWSIWDDAYHFVQDRNKDFIKSNLDDSAIINMKVNLFVFFDNQQNIIYGKMADLEKEKVYNIPPKIISYIKNRDVFFNTKNKDIRTNGIINVDNEIFFISAQPIFKTDGTGPSIGTLLAGRAINKTVIDRISQMTHLNLSFFPSANMGNLSLKKSTAYLKNDKSTYVEIASEDTILGYTVFNDVERKNAFFAVVTIPRDVHQMASATIMAFVISMFTGSLFLILVINFALNRSVVKPIVSLNEKINEIGRSKNLSLRIETKGKDEITALSKEMNTMLESIEESKNSMQRLLDNTAQGFFVFDKDGIISPQFSKAVLTIFAENPASKHISSVFRQSENEWNDYISSLFGEGLDFNDLISLCPKKIEINDRYIELEYRDIRNSEYKLTHVMVVATDMTEVRRLQSIKENESKLNNALIKILISKNDFIEAVQMTVKLDEFKGDIVEFKRKLHTLKGSFAFLGLSQFSDLCHHYEDVIKNNDKDLDKIINELKDKVNQFVDNYDHILKIKNVSGRTLDVPSHVIHNLMDLANKYQVPDDVMNALQQIVERPISEILGWMNSVFSSTAEKYDKQVASIKWLPSDRIDPDYYTHLLKTLIHIPRNAADHGIESPSDREQIGKTREGNLSVELKLKDDNYYFLTIADDGMGLNKSKIIQKANELGQTLKSEQDIIEFIFKDGVSTKDVVTDISGRGVGLSSIRQEAQRLKGDVTLESEEGKGTKVIIKFKKHDHSLNNIISFSSASTVSKSVKYG